MAEEISRGPWWGTAKNLIWSLGPVTVGFFLFMAVNFGWLPSPILEVMWSNLKVSRSNNELNEAIKKELVDHAKDTSLQRSILVRALRQLCRNTAKDQHQRDACDDLDN